MTIIDRLKNDFNFQIKSLQLINILLTIVGVVYLAIDFNWYYLSVALISFLIFGMVGTNAGLHRYFSHHSFEINRFWQYVLAIIGTLCSLGSIISWVAIHRYHHLHTDSEEDPHSPKHIGILRAYIYDWKRVNIPKKMVRDVMGDPMIVFLHRHYFKIISAYVLLLAAIDPLLIIYAYAIPASLCFNSVAAITVIGHTHGYQNHDLGNTSRNSWITWLLTLGEWHNNHHAHPNRWNQRERWWEIDPPSWFIRLIKED